MTIKMSFLRLKMLLRWRYNDEKWKMKQERNLNWLIKLFFYKHYVIMENKFWESFDETKQK